MDFPEKLWLILPGGFPAQVGWGLESPVSAHGRGGNETR